jgi:hypothetical protein
VAGVGLVQVPDTAPVERKRAMQMAMPYVRPTELKATSPAPQAPAVRPDQTPVSGPVRVVEERVARPSPPSIAIPAAPPARLPTGLTTVEETELDIPAFLRHPPRTLE